MIRDILEEKVISRIDNLQSDMFVMMDSVTYMDVSVTAVTTSSNQIYLFAISDILSVPVTCKIDPKKRWIAKIKISCDLSVIGIFYKDKAFDIYPIDSIVKHAYPTSTQGVSEGSAFWPKAISIHEDFVPTHREVFHSPSGSTETVSNVFWYRIGNHLVLMVVDNVGIKLWKYGGFNDPPSVLPLENIVNSCLRVHKDHAIIYAFTSKQMCFSILVSVANKKLNISARPIPIDFSGKLVLVQSSYSMQDQKWELAVLQKDLWLYDGDGHEMKYIPIGEHSRAQPNSFAVTKHFIFYTNGGRVIANFFKNLDKALSAFLYGQQCVNVLDFQRDIVVCLSPNAITILKPKQSPDKMVRSYARQNDWKKAIEVCGGFDLSFQRICSALALENINEGKYYKAHKIFKEGNCELTEIIQRFVQIGKERFALHAAMEAISDDTPLRSLPTKNLRHVGELLLNGLFHKFSIFPIFHTWSLRNVRPEKCLPSPESLSFKTDLFISVKNDDYIALMNIPGALLFRYFKQCNNENAMSKYIGDASKCDLTQPQFTISSGFSALLRQKKRVMKTESNELEQFQLASYQAYVKYQNNEQSFNISLNRKGLYIDMMNIEKTEEFIEFALFANKIYVITNNYLLLEAQLSKDLKYESFSIVNGMPPILTMKSINTEKYSKIGFIALNGTIIIIDNQNNETKQHYTQYQGDFIDICFNEKNTFGLDTNGEVFVLRDQTNEDETGKFDSFYDKHFIKAISCTNKCVILNYSPKKVVLIENPTEDNQTITEKNISFDVEYTYNSFSKCLFAGHGHLFIVDENNRIEERFYSQRIGTIFHISECDDGLVFCGSASKPMLLLNELLDDNKKPNFSDFDAIIQQYKPDKILPLFPDPLYKALFQVLYGMWSTFEIIPNLSDLIPYIPSMKLDQASELLHIMISSNVQIPDDIIILPSARRTLIKHKEDMQKLSQEQIRLILKPKQRKVYQGLDQLSERILQNPVHYASIIPRKVREGGPVTAFSCGHVYNQDELENELNQLTKYCSSKGKTIASEQFEFQYHKPIIQAQCPKCLLKNIIKVYDGKLI